jgi:6-methylsalicylate decarboxylase
MRTLEQQSDVSRRDILKTLGGLAGAATLPEARLFGQNTGSANPRRIDVHHHHRPPSSGRGGEGRGGAPWTPERSLEQMDKYGIAVALVSLTQQADLLYDGTEEGRTFARSVNDYGAKMTHDYPKRFGLLACLPLPQVDASLKEIEYALDTLDADGIGVYTSIGDKYLGDPALAPVFEELNRRKAKIFIHPIPPKCCHDLVPGISDYATELDFDMTRTVTSLLVNGTLVRHRDLTFICAHSGGTLPVLAGRIRDRFPKDKMEMAPLGVIPELQRLYFEVAHAAFPYPLTALMKFVPSRQIMFGTDYPAEPIESTVVPLEAAGLSKEALYDINRGTAERLFPRFKV